MSTQPIEAPELPTIKCSKCNGDGFYADHDTPFTHDDDGNCNSCPVQVQCEACGGIGHVDKSIDVILEELVFRTHPNKYMVKAREEAKALIEAIIQREREAAVKSPTVKELELIAKIANLEQKHVVEMEEAVKAFAVQVSFALPDLTALISKELEDYLKRIATLNGDKKT